MDPDDVGSALWDTDLVGQVLGKARKTLEAERAAVRDGLLTWGVDHPPWIVLRRGIRYSAHELNEWLERQRFRPDNQRAALVSTMSAQRLVLVRRLLALVCGPPVVRDADATRRRLTELSHAAATTLSRAAVMLRELGPDAGAQKLVSACADVAGALADTAGRLGPRDLAKLKRAIAGVRLAYGEAAGTPAGGQVAVIDALAGDSKD